MHMGNCDYEQHNEYWSATKGGEFLDRNIKEDPASRS